VHTIYSYGGGEYLYYIFNFIAMLVSSGDSGISTNVIRMVSLLGVSWSVILMYVRGSLLPGLTWFLWFSIGSFLVIGPKGTVYIQDPIAYGAVGKSVDHVPLILAAGAATFSSIGHNITEKIEAVFIIPGSPSYLKYIETGSLFGSKMIKKLQEVRIEDPGFNANLTRFVQQCVVYDAMIGHKYTVKDLRETNNIWSLVSSKASNILGFLYKDEAHNEILTCREGANLLNSKWNEVIHQTATKQGLRLFGYKIMGDPHYLEQSAKNDFLTKLPQSYKMFGGQSGDAVNLLKQQMMIQVLREAPAKKANQLGNSYAVAKATLQQRNSYHIAGLMAEESLVVMRAVFESLIYGSFVFVYILLFLPAGYKTLGYYFQAICWIQLWAPLYAILNFIMTLYGHYQSRGILGNLGLTRANSAALIDLHTDITALAGWLSLSVPYISFMLINKGGVSAFVHLASHLGSSLGGAINSAAHEKTSGNISLGNFSQGNTNLQTMNAYKHNMNFDFQSGQFSRNLSSGAMKITNPAGNIYLGGSGKTVSTFSTDLTDSNNLSMQLNKHAQQEKSLMDSKSIDYSTQITNTQRNVADLLNRLANSDSNTLTQAKDESFSNNQTLQNAVDFSKRLQKKFGISASAALELSLGSPRFMKNVTGFGLDLVTFHDNLLGLSRCNLLETKSIKNALPASLLQLRCNSPCHFTCS
jgi:conjugal transfer mating pair stabilization protein TraG